MQKPTITFPNYTDTIRHRGLEFYEEGDQTFRVCGKEDASIKNLAAGMLTLARKFHKVELSTVGPKALHKALRAYDFICRQAAKASGYTPEMVAECCAITDARYVEVSNPSVLPVAFAGRAPEGVQVVAGKVVPESGQRIRVYTDMSTSYVAFFVCEGITPSTWYVVDSADDSIPYPVDAYACTCSLTAFIVPLLMEEAFATSLLEKFWGYKFVEVEEHEELEEEE